MCSPLILRRHRTLPPGSRSRRSPRPGQQLRRPSAAVSVYGQPWLPHPSRGWISCSPPLVTRCEIPEPSREDPSPTLRSSFTHLARGEQSIHQDVPAPRAARVEKDRDRRTPLLFTARPLRIDDPFLQPPCLVHTQPPSCDMWPSGGDLPRRRHASTSSPRVQQQVHTWPAATDSHYPEHTWPPSPCTRIVCAKYTKAPLTVKALVARVAATFAPGVPETVPRERGSGIAGG